MMRRTCSATAIIVSVLLSAGCQSEAPKEAESAPAGWPEDFRNFSIVWTSESGIDLASGPAVPIRAYVESFLLGGLTGEQKYFYPGFTDAAEEKWRPGGSSATRAPAGTMTNHLLSLGRSGSDVTAIGCMYTYGVASPKDDEYLAWAVPPGTPEAGIIAFKVTLSAPSDVTGTSNGQSGPARTPSDDVFGGYKVTGYYGGYISAEGADSVWPEYQNATSECIALAPDPLERRKFVSTNYLPRGDFPTLPPSPGWPQRPAGR